MRHSFDMNLNVYLLWRFYCLERGVSWIKEADEICKEFGSISNDEGEKTNAGHSQYQIHPEKREKLLLFISMSEIIHFKDSYK